MTKSKAKFAASLAAKDYGVSRQLALALVHFWFDEGLLPENIPAEILARGIGEYLAASTGASRQRGSSACCRG